MTAGQIALVAIPRKYQCICRGVSTRGGRDAWKIRPPAVRLNRKLHHITLSMPSVYFVIHANSRFIDRAGDNTQ